MLKHGRHCPKTTKAVGSPRNAEKGGARIAAFAYTTIALASTAVRAHQRRHWQQREDAGDTRKSQNTAVSVAILLALDLLVVHLTSRETQAFAATSFTLFLRFGLARVDALEKAVI